MEHQANYPDDDALQRPKDYSVADFRDKMEIIRYRYICGVYQSMLTPLQSIGRPICIMLLYIYYIIYTHIIAVIITYSSYSIMKKKYIYIYILASYYAFVIVSLT